MISPIVARDLHLASAVYGTGIGDPHAHIANWCASAFFFAAKA